MPEKQNTTLPKWPFLAGDIVLVVLACFIVIASPKPMTAITIFACALSVLLGMLVYVTPFVIEHLTQQQRVKLKQAKAEETLLKAVELASNLLNRTESIHAELMKGVLSVKQVPAKLDEKAEEILQILDSDKLTSTVTELEDLLNKLESIPIGPSQTQDATGIADIQKLFDKNSDQRGQQLGATTNSIENSIGELRNEILGRIVQLESQISTSSEITTTLDKITDTPDDIVEDLDSLGVEEDETKSRDPDDSEGRIEDEELEDDFEDEEIVESNLPEDPDLPFASETQIETEIKENEDGATRLLVGAFIGISNKLYIRGEGPGLSQDKGIPMELVGIGKWEWKTYDANSPLRCMVLINDEPSNESEIINIEPNTTVETTASF